MREGCSILAIWQFASSLNLGIVVGLGRSDNVRLAASHRGFDV